MQSLSSIKLDPVTLNRLLRRSSIERLLVGIRIGLYVMIGILAFWLLREFLSGYLSVSADVQSLENIAVSSPNDTTSSARKRGKQEYTTLATNPVFGTIGTKSESAAPAAKPVSSLALNLIGTFITSGEAPHAIIEDDKKKTQDVFNIGDMIFGEAKLVSVLSDRVEINRNGQIEVLKLDESPDSTPGTAQGGITEVGTDEYQVDEDELNRALENLPLLLTQARAVPYFKDGKSIGLRLFAIRTGSLFEKIGLKNGDILKSVNGQSLADMTQAMKLFEKLKEERSVSVALERDRGDREFKYQIR